MEDDKKEIPFGKLFQRDIMDLFNLIKDEEIVAKGDIKFESPDKLFSGILTLGKKL